MDTPRLLASASNSASSDGRTMTQTRRERTSLGSLGGLPAFGDKVREVSHDLTPTSNAPHA